MKIAIAGGSGFVGKALTKELISHHHEVIILTRGSNRYDPINQIQYVQWLTKDSHPEDFLQESDVIINLAGESLNSGRWTEQRKERIVSSRLQAVDALLALINKLDQKPKTFINASAVGYYGTSQTATFTEQSTAGDDFLARTVKEWEHRALTSEQLGIRTVLCRFGIILDKQQGALAKMLLPYRAFIGGTIGSGRQWLSWIHIKDVVKALEFAIETNEVKGPVNFTAPAPVQMKEFGQMLATVLHRPHWLPVPSFALQMLLGEMSILVLEGQKVLPTQLLDNGFSFDFPELSTALTDIFS